MRGGPTGYTLRGTICENLRMPRITSASKSAKIPAIRALAPLAAICLLAAPGAPASAPLKAIDVCQDYHCDVLLPVTLSDADWAHIRQEFGSVEDAADERQRVADAIGAFERLVGSKTETWRDLPRNDGDPGEPGQLDCIAESKNTTTYLWLLQQAGLLRWHAVAERVRRRRWWFSIHWTAVITETATQQAYAVDGWYRRNGMPAMVLPLEDWYAGRRADPD